MLNIQRITPDDFDLIGELKVSDEQLMFVSPIEQIIAQANASSHFHRITMDGLGVGFFIIDTDYASQYDFCQSSNASNNASKILGLRSFFIDSRFQGRGIGQQAVVLLKSYLQQVYTQWSAIVLTVNCKNRQAWRLYSGVGFIDDGEQYLGGRSGPQHIMRMTF